MSGRRGAWIPGALVPRLVMVAVVAGVVAATGGALLLRAVATDALRDRVIERDIVRAEELAGRLDSRIVSTVTALRVVANNRLVSQLDGESVDELRALLRAMPAFDELVLYDGTGTAVAAAASGFAADLVDFPRRADVAALVASDHYVAMSADLPPALQIAVAVESPPGTPVGFVVGTQDLEALAAPIQILQATSTAVNFLVDGGGRVLVHPERDRMVNGEIYPVAALRREGSRQDREGRPMLVAAAPMAELDAWVVVEEDEAQALQPVSAQLQQLVAILIAVLAAAVLAMSVAGQRLLRPLGVLAGAVQRLARGERGVRAGGVGSGEVRLLSDEFDRMAATIDDRDVQLEQLHRLALLVSAEVGREDLAMDLTMGAATLLNADACTFTPMGDDPAARLAPATFGEVADPPAVAAAAAACGKAGEAQLDDVGGGVALSVPVTTLAGATLGVLTLLTNRREFSESDERLARTFASFAGVALDNAHRLQMEQAIVDELQEAIEARRMFVGGVTHELRTPLTCIEGFSTALLEGWDDYPDAERLVLVEKTRRHAQDLDTLVTQLLDFAAAERGRRPAELSVVALDALVEQMRDELSPILEGRRLETDISSSEVLVDPVLLRRALTNLVSNAAKYSPSHSTITVRAVPLGDAVRIDVIDQGIGMSAQEAELAFRPFWRAQGSRARGTGLGLALVAEYVRAMDGTVSVTSQPGRGSMFSFTVPLAPAHQEANR